MINIYREFVLPIELHFRKYLSELTQFFCLLSISWIFQGEEISIGLVSIVHNIDFNLRKSFSYLTSFVPLFIPSQRGFSYGYDYYTPEKAACYHFYKRKEIPMVS